MEREHYEGGPVRYRPLESARRGPVKVVCFSKTEWAEPPRLRHQVASLLAERGHEVVFFEKARATLRPSVSVAPENIELLRSIQLVHHQLRVHSLLSRLNRRVVTAYLRVALSRAGVVADDVSVINFNFDYDFLRELFPRARIVNIFNDDFVAAARRMSLHETRRAIAETARAADCNLAVSYPLVRQIEQFSSRVSLFLPWSRRRYVAPVVNERPDLLYWGYINDRIDYRAMRHVLESGVRVHFVGPVSSTRRSRALLGHPKAVVHGPKQLRDLGEILSRCAASILAYDRDHPMVRAVTMSNRGFDILSCGLPLLYVDLPDLLSVPPGIIYRCKTGDDYLTAFREAQTTFYDVQPAIERFLLQHTPAQRYEELVRYLRPAFDGPR